MTFSPGNASSETLIFKSGERNFPLPALPAKKRKVGYGYISRVDFLACYDMCGFAALGYVDRLCFDNRFQIVFRPRRHIEFVPGGCSPDTEPRGFDIGKSSAVPQLAISSQSRCGYRGCRDPGAPRVHGAEDHVAVQWLSVRIVHIVNACNDRDVIVITSQVLLQY